MNVADEVEFRRIHNKDASSIWANGRLVRASDPELIIALVRAVLENADG